jgi:hypothetical protein
MRATASSILGADTEGAEGTESVSAAMSAEFRCRSGKVPTRGASHQTGWTGLVAKLLQQSGE